MDKIRTAIARWLAPELAKDADRYHRLVGQMRNDYWWLGAEFPDASETIRFFLDGDRNHYRALGEPAIGDLPSDIGDFREHLRRRAALSDTHNARTAEGRSHD